MSPLDTLPQADAVDASPAPTAAASLAKPLLGLLEELDRSGATVARLRVSQWPIIVGRALTADLVLDDAHVAPEHLRIDGGPSGALQVHVLDTVNGVGLGKAVYQRGAQFEWNGDEPLALGHTGLRMRLPGTPVAPEQPLPLSPWRTAGLTVVLLMALAAVSVIGAFFSATDTAKLEQIAVKPVLGLMLVLGGWVGGWSLLTKVFTGHPQFWRHLRVACGFGLLGVFASYVSDLLAFVFSWESLTRFDFVLMTVVFAAAALAHLLIALAPRRRRGLVIVVVSLALLALATSMGMNWLKNKRVSKQMYMSTLLPPSWRLAPTVSVEQFMRETGMLRQRLDERLKVQDDQDGEQGDEE